MRGKGDLCYTCGSYHAGPFCGKHELELKTRIINWMDNNADEYETATALVEAAGNAFMVDDWLDEDTHPIWDWALQVNDWD